MWTVRPFSWAPLTPFQVFWSPERAWRTLLDARCMRRRELSSRRSFTTRPSLGRTRATSCAHRELSLVSSFLWVLKACLYRIGCFGRADSNQSIRLDLDNELEGASPHHSFPLFTTYPRLTCHSLTSLRRPLVHPRRTPHGPRRPEWDGHPDRGAEVFQRPSQLSLLSPKFSFLPSLSARLSSFSFFFSFSFNSPIPLRLRIVPASLR